MNGSTAPSESTPAAPPVNDKLKISLPVLSALAALSIPPPTTSAEVPQTVENLKIKKEWFIANQEKQTAANKAKAEKEIESLLRSINSHNSNGTTVEGSETSQPESPKASEAPVEA